MQDTIYRQAAIDALNGEIEITGRTNAEAVRGYVRLVGDRLARLPSAQPEQRWIPCSERLPDDFEEVNVTWINTDPEPYYDFTKGKPFTGTAVYYKGRWFWYSAVCTDYLREYGFSPNDLMDDSIKVVAWQPIPEPYKGEQE